jgi:hypothetical protein
MKRILLATLIRVTPPMICIMITIMAFREGVNTQFVDVADDSFFTQLYYGLCLFTMGGIDLGMPKGGPDFWRVGLWVTYFAAPLLSVAVVIEGLIATFRPYLSFLWPRKNHLIIAGAGKVTFAFIRQVRKSYPKIPIVVIENKSSADMVKAIQRISGVWVYSGDIYNEEIFDRLHALNAKGIFLLTGNEVANVDAATYIQQISMRDRPVPVPMRVRIADLELMAYANSHLGYDRAPPCINIHRDAALRICRDSLERMIQTEGKDILIFVGFGRFSQTFLQEFILHKGCEEIDQIRILDPRAGYCWAEFLDKVDSSMLESVNSIRCELIEGSVRDPRNAIRLVPPQNPSGSNSVALFGTSLDQLNLRAAIRLHQILPEAFILVRLFEIHHFAQSIADENQLRLISTSFEMQETMNDWIAEIFA